MNKKLRKNLIIAAVLAGNLVLLVAVVMFLLTPDETTQSDISMPISVKPQDKPRAWQKINTINISTETAHTLAVKADGTLLVGDDDGITFYDMNGKKRVSIVLRGGIVALTSDKDIIYAALPRQIIKIAGKKLIKWPEFDSRTRITALAITSGTTGKTPEPQASRLQKSHRQDAYATMAGNAGVPPAVSFLFIADAGNRKVYCYTVDGRKIWETGGVEGETFIIPSPYFDLAPDGNGGIWVVNPGRHRVENYSATGKFKALWDPVPAKTMLGCCNPAYLGVLSGDRFVTLEKGLVRSRLFALQAK